MLDLNEVGGAGVYIDGADEANPARQLIKGGGAALTREKIIAGRARRFVCIVDDSKLVEILGAFPLPVEVIPMARELVARELAALRRAPVWRAGVITDNGNHILDVHGLRITEPGRAGGAHQPDPRRGDGRIVCARPADVLIIGTDAGTRTI